MHPTSTLFKPANLARMAMMLALVIALGQVSIPLPISPVPITGQTLAIILVGLLMTPSQSAIIIGLWLVMGTVGLPVFSMFRSGPEVILGTSGGYIVGFLVCALWISYLKTPVAHYRQLPKIKSLLRNAVVVAVGSFVIIYTLGAWRLMALTGMPLSAALANGVLPFLIGDTIKLVIALLVSDQLYRTAPRLFTTQ